MRIGYARVSTIEQHEERQMIDFAREGDTIYVSEFSRLAHNTKDLLDIVQKLKDKHV